MPAWQVGWCECRPIAVGTLVGAVSALVGDAALNVVPVGGLPTDVLPTEHAALLSAEWVRPTVVLLLGAALGARVAGSTGPADRRHGIANGYFAAFCAILFVETIWILFIGLSFSLAFAWSGASESAMLVAAILGVVLILFAMLTAPFALPGLLFGYVGARCRGRRTDPQACLAGVGPLGGLEDLRHRFSPPRTAATGGSPRLAG